MTLRSTVANLARAIAAISFLACASLAHAQSSAYSEDFTGASTANTWLFYNGACLTAGTNTSTVSPNYIPGCLTILGTYYGVADAVSGKQADGYLSGGYRGYLGNSSAPSSASLQTADPIINGVGHGALRFTNANGNGTNSSYGHRENGAIVSNFYFPTQQGVQITFKSVTYYGDSGGANSDGADGLSFYLLDACMPIAGGTPPAGCPTSSIYGSSSFPGIGAWGGSLAYTCSNANAPYDGLVGAYLGLGIDEYGNFLNGSSNTLGETDGTSTGGDNTASGGLYKPNRIGLRGAGSISWQALNNAYGTDHGSSSPYYPASLGTVCSSGTPTSSGQCATCPGGGTYSTITNTCSAYYCSGGTLSGSVCYAACSSGTLNTTTGTCDNVCPANTRLVGSSCNTCSNGLSNLRFNGTSCSNGGNLRTSSPTSVTATSVPASNAPTLTSGTDLRLSAVQKTCSTGQLWNYSNPSSPVSVGAADLTNTANTAKIMDYPALAWSVLSGGVKIANESTKYREGNPQGCTGSACTSPPATPITYKLKITPDGLLSLAYSYNGGAYQPVIASQSITDSNGAIPSNVRFGFAGSDGGASNIHEIVCFKATQAETSNSSGTVTVYQNPTLKTGTQFFTAFYNPSDWTGQLTATPILFDTTLNSITFGTLPTWDARCVLTGVDSSTGACSTGATSMTAESTSGAAGTGRQIFTWNGTSGVPFTWTNLSTAQQTALGTSSRLDYLRGVRTNEITLTNPTGTFRHRSSILADIVDSSPTWVGPPTTYTGLNTWVDSLYPSTTQPENASTAQSYASFATTYKARQNVVYVGSNDGFVHGFRAGSLDNNGNVVDNSTTPNDGKEVFAYMPATILQKIHNTTDGTLDYSGTNYAHSWFVDATPGFGDVFYGGSWHTWLVGGLGAGGAAIYALDVTDPTQFSEQDHPSGGVIGEWTAANITCANSTSTSGPCGPNLGNTFGTPLIRRFHNGQWGVIFGNGFDSTNGTAGVFVMLLDQTTGAPTFYYFSTNGTTGNGIASAESLDLDLDHVVDYIYAGDLQGNIWRWDVTSNDPTHWGTSSPFLLYTTPGGASQPITTRPVSGFLRTISTTVTLSGQTLASGPERVVINFGTGRMINQTVTSPATFATGTQYLYGVWDWNFSAWNAASAQQAISLSTTAGPGTLTGLTNLVAQTVTTVDATTTQVATRTVSHNEVCWKGTTCTDGSTTGTAYGWYIALPKSGEQILYDPVVNSDGELVVNTVIPVLDSPLVCNPSTQSGFTMGVAPDTGAGGFTGGGSPYFTILINGSPSQVDGVGFGGTGTPSFLSSGMQADNNAEYMVTQTAGGGPAKAKVNRHAIISGHRLNWTQRR